MYSGVPIMTPNSVNNVCSVRCCAVAFATPKSMIFGTGWSSRIVTSTLEGFRSRWMTPFWWACCTPSQTCMNSSRRACVVSRWRSQ